MEKIIVVIDDVAHALQQLQPMRTAGQPTCWLLVACPPRLTRHASRWVNFSAREAWRARWSQDVLDQVTQALQQDGDQFECLQVKGPLAAFTEALQQRAGATRVLDARRPKVGQDLAPATVGQPVPQEGPLAWPGRTAAMGAMLILAAE